MPPDSAQAAPEPKPHAFSLEQDSTALRLMLLIRRFEEKAGQLYGMGFIGGYCHLYIGQEAVAAGIRMAAHENDQLITAYRNHGHLLAWGAAPRDLMAELCGRSQGLCGGKSGSINMALPTNGVYGGHGIVGSNVPIGAGLAFANAYRDNGAVTWCCLGDATADQGQVAETLAMAGRWNLPMVFAVENNRPEEKAQADTPALAERGIPFGIPGEAVDGMNVVAVKSACERAAQHARAGEGPTILELRTQAYRGHSIADPAKYQTEGAQHDRTRASDPIEQVRGRLLLGGLGEAGIEAIEEEVHDLVEDASAFAQSNAEPAPTTLLNDLTAPA